MDQLRKSILALETMLKTQQHTPREEREIHAELASLKKEKEALEAYEKAHPRGVSRYGAFFPIKN